MSIHQSVSTTNYQKNVIHYFLLYLYIYETIRYCVLSPRSKGTFAKTYEFASRRYKLFQ